ncbi:MAG: OmpP1/FadL family transporter, partial [Bradymonadaceae bacterium]
TSHTADHDVNSGPPQQLQHHMGMPGFPPGFNPAMLAAYPQMMQAGYFNPAAYAYQPGLTIGLGGALVMGTMSHFDPETREQTDTLPEAGLPPYAHVAYTYGPFAASLSFQVPFGSGLGWPEDWDGRFEITEIGLQALELSPSFAYRPIPQIAIAAGPRILNATVEFKRKINTVNPPREGSVHLGTAGWGMGWQAAILAEPIEDWTVGLAYRSQVHFDFKGAAHFEDIPIEMSHRAHDTKATTTLVLPERLAFGSAYRFGFGLLLSADLEYMGWRTFEEFAINFESEDVPDVAEPRRWHDTLTFRIGAEYEGPAPGLTVRTGFAIDQSPSPRDTLSPSLPDGNRTIATLGAGYDFGFGLRLDASYGRVFFAPTASEGEAFPGDYRASVNLLSAGVSGRF